MDYSLSLFVNNLNNNSNANGNNNLNNNGHFLRITQAPKAFIMKNNLFDVFCSYENLELAFKKARKKKTTKSYVVAFEKDLEKNLLALRNELLFHIYKPRPLKTFILRDPKTRKISKSAFRDRIVHHALYNVIGTIFEKKFIYDSYANQLGKGTKNAIKRFDYFKRKISKNNTRLIFVLKGDIKQYFENVDHTILLSIIEKQITDKRLLWLIRIILSNYNTKIHGKGMPLGNLTSQFFANVYLNGLDQYVKHKLKIKYYVRYVDDFVILHRSKKALAAYKQNIHNFLREQLHIKLHPEKSRVFPFNKGITFLGFKIFYYHKLIKKRNLRKFSNKLKSLSEEYAKGEIDYDIIYDFLEGWFAYAKQAHSYNFRMNVVKFVDEHFSNEISTKEINRLEKVYLKKHHCL